MSLKFGILACSNVARRRFLPALATAAGATLERVGSRDPAKAAKLAREHGCAKSGSYEGVLTDPAVDAVYISTPPPLHEEWCLRAAASGKHVLCEKPAFLELASAERVLAVCERAGVRLMEGYMFLFHPQHALARSLVGPKGIGEPLYFSGEFSYPRPDPGDYRLNPALAGGTFSDSLGYPLAAALEFFPHTPVSVSAGLVADLATGVDRASTATLVFDQRVGGRVAHAFAGFGLHYRSRYSVLGTLGRLEVERAYAVPADHTARITLETDAGIQVLTVDPADQFRLMIEEFARGVRSADNRDRCREQALLLRHRVMDSASKSLGSSGSLNPQVEGSS